MIVIAFTIRVVFNDFYFLYETCLITGKSYKSYMTLYDYRGSYMTLYEIKESFMMGNPGNHSKIIYEIFVGPVWKYIWYLDIFPKNGQPVFP